jgi:hypothetical protein
MRQKNIKKQNRMRPKKGGIISWLIFIVVVLVFFGLLFTWRHLSEQHETISVDSEEATQNLQQTRKLFATKTLTEKDKKSSDQHHFNQALLSGSLAICESIQFNETLRQSCIDNINYAVFLKGGNEKKCAELADAVLRQQCLDRIFYTAATDEFNADLCTKIVDSTLKQDCFDKIQMVFGAKAETLSDCDSITSNYLKADCRNNFYFSSGLNGLNEATCDHITDLTLQSRCRQGVTRNKAVVALSQKKAIRVHQSATVLSGTCDQFTGEAHTMCQDKANYDLTLEKKDLNYCSRIQDLQQQEKCLNVQGAKVNRYHLKQAIREKNPALCNVINSETLKNSCIINAQ